MAIRELQRQFSLIADEFSHVYEVKDSYVIDSHMLVTC